MSSHGSVLVFDSPRKESEDRSSVSFADMSLVLLCFADVLSSYYLHSLKNLLPNVFRLPQHRFAAEAEYPVEHLDAAVGGEFEGQAAVLLCRDDLVGAPDALADVHGGLGDDVHHDAERFAPGQAKPGPAGVVRSDGDGLELPVHHRDGLHPVQGQRGVVELLGVLEGFLHAAADVEPLAVGQQLVRRDGQRPRLVPLR